MAQLDELNRLRRENEALRAGAETAAQKPAAKLEDSFDEALDLSEFGLDELSDEEEDFDETEDLGLDDDFDAHEDLNTDLDEEEDEDYGGELDSGELLDLLTDSDEENGEDDDLLFFSDDEDEESSDDEDEEEEEEDDEDDDFDSDDEDEEDEDDILSSFFSFSNELKTMTVFEKMRFDGRTVEPISFETLESLVEAQKERRRRERLNASSDQV